MTAYVVAPHLLWAMRWAEEQFRAGVLDIKTTTYSTGPGALEGIPPDSAVYLVNPVMCTGRKWALVKEALALSRAGRIRVTGASTEVVFRFTQEMQKNPRYIPFEPKLDV